MHRFLLLAALCMSAPTAYACGVFQDRFERNGPAGWPACIDVSVDAPETVSVITQSGVNDDRQNFSEVTILPDFGHILRRSQVSTTCGAELVWQSNKVRIEPVTEACDLIIGAPRFSPMPDTGITTCSSETELADCSIEDYPGQDGQHGLDSLDDLIKIGAGAGSRDFTKLGADGEPLPANASNWSCVRDNQTGLVWERKVNNSGSIHHFSHSFTWYNEDDATNGGGAGTENGGICGELIDCDTSGLVNEVNSNEFCGRTDWSLPSPVELSGLLSWLDVSASSLLGDSNFFPSQSTGRHLTFVPASDIGVYGVSASSLDSSNGGIVSTDSKSIGRAALLVSRQDAPQVPSASNPPLENPCGTGFPATAPSSYFSVLGDGSMVRDERTGLVWQRCMLSQSWNSGTATCDDPVGGVSTLTWQQALQAADAEMPSGWRLPNRHEAITILEHCNVDPPINAKVFPNAKSRINGVAGQQWTSSPNIQRPAFSDQVQPNRAWHLEMTSSGVLRGRGDLQKMTEAYYVRLVRDDVPFTELSVTSSGSSAYMIDDESNPTLQLVRGQSYRFNVNASGHPFLIKTEAVTGEGSTFDDGVTNNGAEVGVVQFDVPLDAPNTLFYICKFHSSMQGQINIIEP